MERKNNFLANRFTYGLVIKANLETIEDIKKYIANHDDINVIFQKISTDNLWIKGGD